MLPLYDFVETQQSESFDDIVGSAVAPQEQAVGAAVQAACFVEEGQPDKAYAVLTGAIETDEMAPVDQAWLQVQLSRCMRELGERTNAQHLALEIQKQRLTNSQDPTLLAICGAAADIVFSTSPFSRGDVAETIMGRGTPTAWWRSQVMSVGLIDHFETDFKVWSDDQSETIGKADTAWLNLRAVSLMSGFAGDHASWRQGMSLLARRQLITSGPEGDLDFVASSLDSLRLAGDRKNLEHATKRVVLDGPAGAARQVGQAITLERSTGTSVHCDIVFLTRAADVLDNQSADEAARWALEVLTDPEPFIARYQPMFAVQHTVLQLLGALVTSVSNERRREVIEHLLNLPAQEDQFTAHSYATVVNALKARYWTSDDLQRLASRPEGDNWELKGAIDRLLARRDRTTIDRLNEEVSGGSLRALDSIPDYRDLTPEAAGSAIGFLRDKLGQQRASARLGAWGAGGQDLGQTLTILNMWHPSVADWNPIAQLLEERAMAPSQIEGTISVIIAMPDQIPKSVVEEILPLLRELTTRPSVALPLERRDIRGHAADALNVLQPGAVTDDDLWALMHGNNDQRASAVLIIARRKNLHDLHLLASLARDEAPEVRAAVVGSLAVWVKQGISHGEADRLLLSLLEGRGTRLARNVAANLAESPTAMRQSSGHLFDYLEKHISATVREYIAPTSSQ